MTDVFEILRCSLLQLSVTERS